MHSTRMHTKRFAIAATTVALAAPALVVAAAPANAANIDLGTRTGDVVAISAPANAKVNKKFKVTCAAPAELVGGKVHLYQNGNIFNLSKVKVNAAGACNFKVKSGIKGLNTFDVAIKKAGTTYQSNSINVQVGQKTTLAKQPKGKIKLTAKSTTTLWAKFKIKCTAPQSLAGGRVTLYQNGAILPQNSAFAVSSDGSCNFWIKSGIAGENTFDMSVLKNGRSYQSNAIKVMVS